MIRAKRHSRYQALPALMMGSAGSRSAVTDGAFIGSTPKHYGKHHDTPERRGLSRAGILVQPIAVERLAYALVIQ